MVIDPDEAGVVQLLRDWVLRDGYGTPTIARLLNEQGIKTPGRSVQWSAGGYIVS
jgi:hypothetical protein